MNYYESHCYEDMEGKVVKHKFECPICYNLKINPISHFGCGTSYGKQCFSKCQECPVRCGNHTKLYTLNIDLKDDVQNDQKIRCCVKEC